MSAGDSRIGWPAVSSTALPDMSASVPSGIGPNRPLRVSRGPFDVATVKYPVLVNARSNGLPVWVSAPAAVSRQVARSCT